MSLSAKDRSHFDRIREAKRAERDERLDEALEKPAIARIIEGLELGAMAPNHPGVEASLDRRALGQADLQARARELGLR